ncbi:PAPP5, partial [Symbiodinium necroappetens]
GISIESFLSLFEMTFHPHATGQVRVPGWVTASLRVLGGLIWQGTSGEEPAGSCGVSHFGLRTAGPGFDGLRSFWRSGPRCKILRYLLKIYKT